MYKKSPECLGIVSGNCAILITAKTPAMLRFLRGVPQSLHANAWTLPQIRPCLLLLRHFRFTFHCHSVTPRFIPRVLLKKPAKQLKNAKHCVEWHRDSVKSTIPCATGSGNSNQLTLLALGNEGAWYTGERGPSVTGNLRSPTVEGGVARFWCKNWRTNHVGY
jgi:hypothetical protein